MDQTYFESLLPQLKFLLSEACSNGKAFHLRGFCIACHSNGILIPFSFLLGVN